MNGDHGLDDLDKLYSDLWKDAREIVLDMARTVSAYWFSGLWMSIIGLVMTLLAIGGWYRLLTGSPNTVGYAFAIGGTILGVPQLIGGLALLRRYLQLMKRYPGLAQLPPALYRKRAPNEPVAGEDLQALKKLYDGLWRDARGLTTDMNEGIAVYGATGLVCLVYGLAFIIWALVGFNLFSGRASVEDYFVAACLLVGGLPQLAVGPYVIYWYFKLKRRYARLIRMERDAGVDDGPR